MSVLFFERLSHWYSENQRSLPWRNIDNPYYIWVSEIILQQTRVEQGIPYYHRFIAAFPTIAHLANADEQQVLRIWQGLGYYSRARNMHAAAKQILSRFNGVFPQRYEDIVSLKGIGKYTAAAVASFAFGLPYPAIDGNVLRVASRIFGIEAPINKTTTHHLIEKRLKDYISAENAAVFNHAMMDFGSMCCVPKRPHCDICPMADFCVAKRTHMQAILPIKEKTLPPKDRYLCYVVFLNSVENRSKIWIKRRTEKDIWQNMFDFPILYDSLVPMEMDQLQRQLRTRMTERPYRHSEIDVYACEHVLSHFRLHVAFLSIMVADAAQMDQEGNWVEWSQLSSYPLPRLIEKYLFRR